MDTLFITAQLEVCEGVAVEEARDALAALAEVSLTEPGCYQFDVLQDRREPRRFYLWEKWQDVAALEHHFTLPHTLETINRKLVKIVQADHLDVIFMPANTLES